MVVRWHAGLVTALAAIVALAVAAVLLTQNTSDRRALLLSKDKKWALKTLVQTAQWKEQAEKVALAKAIRSASLRARATYPGDFEHETVHAAKKLHALAKPHVVPKEVEVAEHKAAKFNTAAKVLHTEEQRIGKLRQMVEEKGKEIRGLTRRAKHADRAAAEDEDLHARILQERDVEERTYHQELAALTREARRAVQLEKKGASALATVKGRKPVETVVPKEVEVAEHKAAKFNTAAKVLHTEEQRIGKLRQMVEQKGKEIRGLTRRAKHADRAAAEDEDLHARILQEREVEERTYHQELAALTREARRAVQLEKKGASALATVKPVQSLAGDEAGGEEEEAAGEESVELQKVPGNVGKEECMPPDVWMEDACRQSPRLDEPPLACGAHPDPEACEAWKGAWKKKMVAYKKALRDNYPYRYEPEHHLVEEGWGKHEVNNVAMPVRYPHKDLADLGDNYVSTSWSDRHHGQRPRPMADDIILPREKAEASKSAEGFMRTFVGKGERVETPLYAARMVTPEEKARLADEEANNLFFAQNGDRMGERSPTEPEVKRLLYGRSSEFMRNKFGYLADVFPSTHQMQRQLQPENSRERRRAYPPEQEGKGKTEGARYTGEGLEQFPARTNLASRFRRECPTCDWKPTLEPASEPCAGELCSATKPEVHPAVIKVCDPVQGCVEHKDWVHTHDAMERQILDGQVNGRADPWGLSAELGDDRMSPEKAVTQKRYA